MKSACLCVVAVSLAACVEEDAIDPASCDAPRVYQIDRVELPRSSADAHEAAFDLDGDGMVDNALGQVGTSLLTMFSDVPLDLTSQTELHLATDTDFRISVADCGPTARLVSIGRPDEAALPGVAVDGRIRAAGPAGAVPLVAVFDGAGGAVSLFASSEQTELAVTEDGDQLSGAVGFAIEARLAGRLVIHAMTAFIDRYLETGRDELDADHDGVVSESEVAANAFAQALLGSDLVVDHVDALSLGVTLHATRLR